MSDAHPVDPAPEPPAPPPPGNGWAPISVMTLASKELRETLRDRRTIITLFLMPLLVYPILSLLFQGFLANSLKPQGSPEQAGDSAEAAVSALEPEEELPPAQPSHEHDGSGQPRFVYLMENMEEFEGISRALNQGYVLMQQLQLGIETETAPPDPRIDYNLFNSHIFQVRTADNGLTIREMIQQNEGDVGIIIKQSGEDANRTGPPEFELIYRDDLLLSVQAVRLLEGIFDALNVGALRNMLRMQGGTPPPIPVRFAVASVAPPASGSGISFTALIPLILTLMTITGAVYPAIDLTAGERERGTLESLVAAPIPRMRILLGKLVAVVAVSMLTAVVNLVGMTITIWVFQFDTMLFGEQGLTLVAVFKILALLVLFAAFFSSVLLVITSFARSFKEGQAYLIPVMMVALAPSLMSLKPDLELTGIWAVTPLVNIVLLSRDVLTGDAQWPMALVAIVSTLFYALLAITLAARFFGTAKVLYGQDEGIGMLFRRPTSATPVASASMALLCLALLFPASFLWQGLLMRLGDRGTEFVMLAAASGLLVVFVLIPTAMALFHRVRLLSGFNVRRASGWCFLSALLLGLGLGPLLMQAIASSGHWLEYLQAGTGSREALIETAEAQAERLRQTPWLLVIFCFAITPAICEELFFRGLLFRALRASLSPTGTIVATGLMFGAFHLITTSGLGISRFIPTTVMGFALGWLCYKSGSVIPGIVLHAIYNTLGLSLGYFRNDMVARGWITEDQNYIPLEILAIALILSYIGFAILHLRVGVVGKPEDRPLTGGKPAES